MALGYRPLLAELPFPSEWNAHFRFKKKNSFSGEYHLFLHYLFYVSIASVIRWSNDGLVFRNSSVSFVFCVFTGSHSWRLVVLHDLIGLLLVAYLFSIFRCKKERFLANVHSPHRHHSTLVVFLYLQFSPHWYSGFSRPRCCRLYYGRKYIRTLAYV